MLTQTMYTSILLLLLLLLSYTIWVLSINLLVTVVGTLLYFIKNLSQIPITARQVFFRSIVIVYNLI